VSKKLDPSLKRLALQIALQLPDDQREAISILRYAREIVERERVQGTSGPALRNEQTPAHSTAACDGEGLTYRKPLTKQF
jgi:hypothetical protein